MAKGADTRWDDKWGPFLQFNTVHETMEKHKAGEGERESEGISEGAKLDDISVQET